jgi:glutamate-1-semialdehyde 2,1-aminomutase
MNHMLQYSMLTEAGVMTTDKPFEARMGHNRASVLGERSRAEFKRARRITPGGSMRSAPFFAPHPPYAMSGQGAWITDADGRQIFDCANNFFSLIHGHAFPAVIGALQQVLQEGTAFGLPTVAETELAEEIRSRSPALEHVRFTGSGTEAVMFAVKAARALTGRPAIAKFEGAYHGAYDYVEVSLDPTPETWGASVPTSLPYALGTPASVAEEVVVLPYDKPDQCREIIAANRGRLAAVVLDPMSSRIAMVPLSTAVRDTIQECCRRFGILLLLDEVVSYRMGHGGAHRLLGYEPDLVALAKIIGGGLPIGAVAGPAHNMAAFDHTMGKAAVSHGGTFSANPLSMTAGLVSLKSYDPAAVARLNGMGEALRADLSERIRVRGIPAQVTGASSFFRLHLKAQLVTDYRNSFPTAAQRVALKATHISVLERGVLLTPNCSGALSTPMTNSDMRDAATAIVEGLQDVWRQSPWDQGRET